MALVASLTGGCLLLAGTPAADADVTAGNPRVPNGAWASMLAEHPRLWGPRAHPQALARAKPELYREIHEGSSLEAAAIRQAVEGARSGHAFENLLTPVEAAAIRQAVEGVPREQAEEFIRKAREHVARGATNEHQDTWLRLTDVAFTYDTFFDLISPDDRQAMIDWMNAHLASYTDDENAFHNSTLSKILCYLRVAYATWGENPRAKEFRDHALLKLYEGRLLPVLRELGAGGGFTECGWYCRHCLFHLAQALEMARLVEGYDGFAKAPRFFYQRMAYEMLQPYPGTWERGAQRYSMEGDGSRINDMFHEYPRLLRTMLAQYFRGSELSRYVAGQARRGTLSLARMFDFLYEEEPDKPLGPQGFPLAHLAAGVGKVYARGGWSDDASWLRFECGDYWNQHQHLEAGNFEIFRREPLATESGEYTWGSSHAVNWQIRTIAHNCILVHQPDETWTRMRDGGANAPYANDGGQAKKWDFVAGTLEEWRAKRQQYERGQIVAYDSQPGFMFVAGDCTKAYVPSKLALWIRQILFVHPHTFVIFDRVVSTRPEYEKTWVMHCRFEPQIEDGIATITNGAGRLVSQTLLPLAPVIRKVEGYTYGGQDFSPKPSRHSELAERWRVEVRPEDGRRETGDGSSAGDSSDARAKDLFLHVLSTDGAPAATLMRRGTQIGARFGDAEVLFDGRVGGTLVLAGKRFPLRAEVRRGKCE